MRFSMLIIACKRNRKETFHTSNIICITNSKLFEKWLELKNIMSLEVLTLNVRKHVIRVQF